MTLLTVFIGFLDNILSFRILNIQLIDYLILFAILTVVFAIIKAMANSKK